MDLNGLNGVPLYRIRKASWKFAPKFTNSTIKYQDSKTNNPKKAEANLDTLECHEFNAHGKFFGSAQKEILKIQLLTQWTYPNRCYKMGVDKK